MTLPAPSTCVATPQPPLGGLNLRAALSRLVAAVLARQEYRRQMRAFARLDDHLLRDIGLPPRSDGSALRLRRHHSGL